MFETINRIRNELKRKSPLVHSITNPISINQCANAALAVGARPIMAEHPQEVAEIASSASALLLNTGNITDVRMGSIEIAIQTAKKSTIPTVLDPVGIACSSLRRDFVKKLIKNFSPTLIKGNYSEIYALADNSYQTYGVDASSDLDVSDMQEICRKVSKKYNTVVLASGKTDIIASEAKTVLVLNGTPLLSSVTGTGCMLGELTACFLAVSDAFEASVCAAAVLGISGEMSSECRGNGSFAVNLMDNLSRLGDEDIKKTLKLEVKINEKL